MEKTRGAQHVQATDARNFSFTIDPQVTRLGVKGSYLTIRGLRNAARNEDFERIRRAVVDRRISELSANLPEADKQLAAFRRLHGAVGPIQEKIPSSPEHLISYVLRKRDLPRINLVVDIYNLVSLETTLALGAHDVSGISGNVFLRLTRGDERFWPIGATRPEAIPPGEYAYVDDDNEVICRMEARQVEKTKVAMATTDCFYIIQGTSETGDFELEASMDRLLSLTRQFCGGDVTILSSPFGI